MAMHPTEHAFAAASAENTKKYKLPEGEFLHNMLQQQKCIVNAMAVNEDGVMATGGDNGSLWCAPLPSHSPLRAAGWQQQVVGRSLGALAGASTRTARGGRRQSYSPLCCVFLALCLEVWNVPGEQRHSNPRPGGRVVVCVCVGGWG